MEQKVNFSLRDILIVIFCVLFLMLNIAAVGSNGRERAKRAVCLTNLNRLTTAWILYAVDNDGKIVNGSAGYDNDQNHRNEYSWVGRDWSDSYYYVQLPQEQQQAAIKSGALWPYCRNIRLYHCPSGRPGEGRNYSIVDSMNGYPRQGTYNVNTGIKIGQTVLWLKKMSEIRTPGPAHRAVFIDEGWLTPDSYAVHYVTEAWWDDPPVRHSNGVTLSFADGHVEHWMWKGPDTVNYGWSHESDYMGSQFTPATNEGREDLHRLQTAVWGRLGYVPNY
jgi:prepilin-type processing-associated H-X9-DG protein